MRLSKLLEGVRVSAVCADGNFEVKSLKIDSREVGDGDLFFV